MLLIARSNSFHICSMGLQSGDCASWSISVMSSCCRYSVTTLERWGSIVILVAKSFSKVLPSKWFQSKVCRKILEAKIISKVLHSKSPPVGTLVAWKSQSLRVQLDSPPQMTWDQAATVNLGRRLLAQSTGASSRLYEPSLFSSQVGC